MTAIFGTELEDRLRGTTGDDYLSAFQGNDTVDGLGGDDVLVDGFGNDLMRGGNGDDYFLNIGGAEDTFDGGLGFDWFYEDLRGFGTTGIGVVEVNLGTGLHKGTERVTGDLFRSIEAYEMDGVAPVDGTGDAKANLFMTDRGADTLRGQNGADTLDSGRGNDRLFGGNGNDELIGGKGRDTVTGGKGADTFVFEKGDGRDRYTDFKAAQDTLALDVAFYTIGDSIAEFLDKVATDTGRNVRLDFGGGDQILLVGVRTVASLEDAIEFI